MALLAGRLAALNRRGPREPFPLRYLAIGLGGGLLVVSGESQLALIYSKPPQLFGLLSCCALFLGMAILLLAASPVRPPEALRRLAARLRLPLVTAGRAAGDALGALLRWDNLLGLRAAPKDGLLQRCDLLLACRRRTSASRPESVYERRGVSHGAATVPARAAQPIARQAIRRRPTTTHTIRWSPRSPSAMRRATLASSRPSTRPRCTAIPR